jgi:ABC-type transporter Mla subunit MlaD
MGRKKMNDQEVLKHEVKTRVSKPTFEKLQKLLGQKPNAEMSSLVRDILENRRIKLFTYDQSLDKVMEELSALRVQIKAIGININQITRQFNTYSEERKKEFYAKIALERYISLDTKIDQTLEIITKLSEKWLSE